MPRTLGMIKTSDSSADVQNLCLYLKLFASPCFDLCVAKCGHAFDGVKLIYLKPCETCVMLGATFLAFLAR